MASDQQQAVKQFVLNRVARCNRCRSSFSASDVRVLGHNGDTWFLVVVCDLCSLALGVAVLVGESSPPTVPPDVVTAPPITADEALDLHEFLEDFDGDFKQLFESKTC